MREINIILKLLRFEKQVRTFCNNTYLICCKQLGYNSYDEHISQLLMMISLAQNVPLTTLGISILTESTFFTSKSTTISLFFWKSLWILSISLCSWFPSPAPSSAIFDFNYTISRLVNAYEHQE